MGLADSVTHARLLHVESEAILAKADSQPILTHPTLAAAALPATLATSRLAQLHVHHPSSHTQNREFHTTHTAAALPVTLFTPRLTQLMQSQALPSERRRRRAQAARGLQAQASACERGSRASCATRQRLSAHADRARLSHRPPALCGAPGCGARTRARREPSARLRMSVYVAAAAAV